MKFYWNSEAVRRPSLSNTFYRSVFALKNIISIKQIMLHETELGSFFAISLSDTEGGARTRRARKISRTPGVGRKGSGVRTWNAKIDAYALFEPMHVPEGGLMEKKKKIIKTNLDKKNWTKCFFYKTPEFATVTEGWGRSSMSRRKKSFCACEASSRRRNGKRTLAAGKIERR